MIMHRYDLTRVCVNYENGLTTALRKEQKYVFKSRHEQDEAVS
jgi:hypothetical protein